jgi:hypothetical protein
MGLACSRHLADGLRWHRFFVANRSGQVGLHRPIVQHYQHYQHSEGSRVRLRTKASGAVRVKQSSNEGCTFVTSTDTTNSSETLSIQAPRALRVPL